MSVLVVNAGSTSLKFSLFDANAVETLASGIIDWAGEGRQAETPFTPTGAPAGLARVDVHDHRAAATHAVRSLVEHGLIADGARGGITVGHRVVHGSGRFRNSVLIDGDVKAAISELEALAPLHNPPALKAIEAAETVLPGARHVAIFAGLPPATHVYPLPYEWYRDWGVRRFGFHGISHAYSAGRAAEMLGAGGTAARLVTCHLGGGASAAAIRKEQVRYLGIP